MFNIKAKILRHLINLWPPLLFNSIKVTYISDDYREINVRLNFRWFNRNAVRAHFGGNLFSMSDPWYMLMIMQNLGSDYYVWDKKATIEFIAPGRSAVTATFMLTEEALTEIRGATANGEKYLHEFVTDIFDTEQKQVARVHRTVYIKLKPAKK